MILTFAKNNCTGGATGSFVDYDVPAGSYSSIISQSDANSKALNDLNTNGQNYANTHGECRWYNGEMAINWDKNDCPGGSTGSTVRYVVPAGKYSSTISQDDADDLAEADLYGNAQTYANENGSCILTTINVLLTNSGGDNVDVWLYSTTSDDYYFINIPPNRSDVPFAVPPGTYDVVLWPDDSGSSSHYYHVGCSHSGSGYGSMTFEDVYFGPESCNTISFD
jgi:hypothetical protein